MANPPITAVDPNTFLPVGKSREALDKRFNPAGHRAAAFGDSITATTNDYVNNALADSWFTYMLLASNGRLRYAGNYAQGGTTTTQILAQMRAVFAAQFLTRPFDVAFIDAGTNDNLDGNSLPNPAAANIKAMVALCRANGVKPVLCTLQPAGVIGQLGAPTNAPTVATASGGTLAAGTYYYAYTRANFGETPIGPASAAATLNAAGSVVVTLPADKGATYNVYRSTTGAGGSWQRVATLGFVTSSSWVPQQTWTDTGVAGGGAPPTNDSTAGNISPAARLKNSTISRWLRRYAAVESIDLIEFATLSDGSGMWPTGGSKDGTHPTPASSRLMGQLAWSQVGHRFPSLAAQLTNDSYDPLNLAPNGCFTYVNGQGLPQYWGGYGGSAGIVRTAAPKAAFVGNAYTLQRSDATPYYDGPNGITTGWSVGDRLLFGFKLQTEGVEASNALVTVGAKFTGATAAPSSLGSLTIGGDVGPSAAWFEEVVPAGTTQVGVTFSITNAGNIGTATPTAKASLGQVTVYNATTGQLLTP